MHSAANRAMYSLFVFLLVCFTSANGEISSQAADSADPSQLRLEIKSLRAELEDKTKLVDALRAQLEAAQATAGQSCSADQRISVLGAVSKTGSIAGDVFNHLLQKTDIDEKVVSTVTGHVEAAKVLKTQVYDQITAHPCGSDYNECVKNITGSAVYMTHVAPHVKSLTIGAQPYMDSARVYVAPAFESALKTAEHVEIHVVPTVKQRLSLVHDQISEIASKTPEHFKSLKGHLHNLIDPIFVAFGTASPQHGDIIPHDAMDRLLLLCVYAVVGYYWLRLASFIGWYLARILLKCGFHLPLWITKMSFSWGFWFGTGFYVCGLCRRRRKATQTNVEPTKKGDAKANGEVKPVQVDELVKMLKKAEDKGKLNDGVARLATAAKSGKPLQGPEDMKGKRVAKDVLKSALSKFKSVDIKKLGL